MIHDFVGCNFNDAARAKRRYLPSPTLRLP
jgi:hypothetical protein